jgi:Ca-activated chloride channel homolog
MFGFDNIWLAILLPLPVLVWLLLPQRQAQINQLYMPNLMPLKLAYDKIKLKNGNLWHWLLLWWLWISLVLAAMAPRWLDTRVEIVQPGYDIMLAVDLSQSMLKQDFWVQQQMLTRLQAVKWVLAPFIEQRLGDRLGLIVFADNAYLQSPLSIDNQAIKYMLQRLEIGLAGSKTAIGDAMGLGIDVLRTRTAGAGVLILLTDGVNNTGSVTPIKAAELAQQYAIPIYTVGMGTVSAFGSEFDEQTLRQIADMTGGLYFAATDTQGLAQVYQAIHQNLQQAEAESRIYVQATPLYRIPLLSGLVAWLSLSLLRLKLSY